MGGKRSADAEAAPEAKPYYAYGYPAYGYYGYGKRSADAKAKPEADAWYGYGGLYGYGYPVYSYGYGLYGRRSAEAEPEAKPYYAYGYPAYGYYGYGKRSAGLTRGQALLRLWLWISCLWILLGLNFIKQAAILTSDNSSFLSKPIEV